MDGGHFAAYDEIISDDSPIIDSRVLRWQHSAARRDTLSFSLLERVGIESKFIRKNRSGDVRSLSFRDIARLCVVTEDEIQKRISPFLTGQVITATAEYSALKFLLTGLDDSSLVSSKKDSGSLEQESGKIELLDQMINELQADIDEDSSDEEELIDQLARINGSIKDQDAALSVVQKKLDEILERRGLAAKELRDRKARVAEIDELVGRFGLLDTHYSSDLSRLEAIHESGSLFVHLEQKPCPLCGALPGDQHLDTECDGNTEAVVMAADAEMFKIKRLRRELSDTVVSLRDERSGIVDSLEQYQIAYSSFEKELKEIASPAVAQERESYNQLISMRAEIRMKLDKTDRLNRLIEQRNKIEEGGSTLDDSSDLPSTQISKSLLDDFAKTVKNILEEWHFPNAERLFFDEKDRDFLIAGKKRGSTGKGLRAITHAAVMVGLMEFCREHGLPHPGFLVLDSPLLVLLEA